MDYSALIAKAVAEGPDVKEAVSGGGGTYEPPAAGLARLRLVEYIEYGEHMDGPKGEEKRKSMAMLKFELSGPKHPAKEVGEGTDKRLIPHTITIRLSVSRNEKANYYKLFKRMNWQGNHSIFPQMLGEDFLGTVVIVTKGEGDTKRVYANLKDDGGYTVRSPFVEDADSGEQKRVAADPAISPVRCFMWDYVDKASWDSLFIDGMHEAKKDDKGVVTREAQSKNWIQSLIKTALNFNGSPLAELLGGGDALNIPDSETPERKEAANDSDDPLAGVAA